MNIGDKLTWTPSGFEHRIGGQRADRVHSLRTVTGRIVYIHPARRFYLAEAQVGGAVIRECFPIKQK